MNRLPSTQTMYRALLNRDTSFEGVFYVGVKTTGIFCRPTCPARKPRPENVEYFATPRDALYGGYRPCSRCSPMDREKRLPELVRRLRDVVEQSPTGRLSNAELRALGIDPSTARRQFQRYYGMTFHAYHRARRMGQALHEVRNGEAVIMAQLNNGFESASGFWEAFKRVFGVPPSQAEQVNCLQAKWIETPLGAMLALANDEGLHLLEFIDGRRLEKELLELRKRTGCAIVPGNHPYLDQISEELTNYFDGTAVTFTVPTVIAGSPFERDVWALLQTIPPGETWSYSQMAQRLGNPKAIRAVGRANGRNRLAVVIPCHRVIRSDGSLCGYGGGIWRKQWLLDHERQVTGQAVQTVKEPLFQFAS
ncbi:MAG TPA: trifunctional transcriptional activator/DNA repair protein Ada/methylated-DNA--[protein]-cysteine S-methyltransferase [Blastocatellia bacterium]|nr:trifunctional transcriptional activator/DNA repair protein Ada/methylated-DNA--[protein]-cysteine S-methyltransferase [Blastocatellia bacterium]